jgi:sugar/nucleoside kinase (ribokinase family)
MFDVIFNAEHPIKVVPGGTGYCSTFHFSPGGAGNVAVALARLGEKTVFAGKAGNDLLGKMYIDDLRNNEVLPQVFIDKQLSTGVVLVLSSSKERSFIVYSGANTSLTPHEMLTLKPLIENSSAFYFPGFALTENPQREAVIKAAKIARAANVKVVFDPGSYNLISQNPSLFTRILGITNVLSINEAEAKSIAHSDQLDKIIENLTDKVPLVAIRLGSRGSIIATRDAVVKTAAHMIAPRDTSGAGDAYTAALIHGLNLDLPLSDVGKLANWFAAQKVRNYGARAFPKTKFCQTYLNRLTKANFERCL